MLKIPAPTDCRIQEQTHPAIGLVCRPGTVAYLNVKSITRQDAGPGCGREIAALKGRNRSLAGGGGGGGGGGGVLVKNVDAFTASEVL